MPGTAERTAIPTGAARRRSHRRRGIFHRRRPRPRRRGRGGHQPRRGEAGDVCRRRGCGRGLLHGPPGAGCRQQGQGAGRRHPARSPRHAQRPRPAREARQCRGEARDAG